jgi:bifunctional non-homologous end joining protein LigD
MYATIGTRVPAGPGWTYEQKFDGMRVVALASAKRVRLVTRNGRDKAAQFPEIVSALRDLARRVRRTLIVDGEVVAIAHGRPAPFQALQPRMQLKDAAAVRAQSERHPSALVVFDLLRDGRTDLTKLPWRQRRARLERLPLKNGDDRIRISASSTNGARMLAEARRRRWEGVIAKRTEAPYLAGVRSSAWLKLKLQHRAEFVVGGYTEPRRTREAFGALLLGYFDRGGRLCYAGHMGGGLTRRSLREMFDRLRPLERPSSPFAEVVKTNEPAHWVAPRVVVEVKFAEWTADGKLRQPVFLGVRDDKSARDVGRERESLQAWSDEGSEMTVRTSSRRSAKQPGRRSGGRRRRLSSDDPIVRQLDEIQSTGGDGTLDFGRGRTLRVSSLDKV